MPSKHSRVCAELFTEDSFEHNLTVKSLLGLSFKPCQLAFKRDAVLTISNFTVEHCKPTIGQIIHKKKPTMPSEKRANSLAISQVK